MTLLRLNCKQVIELLAEYLEATLGADLLSALERHLANCPACVAYLRTYRKTRQLAADAGRVEMPAEVKARLREFLLAELAGGAV